MFHHIEGKVAELEPYLAVIDCGGVGFGLNVTANTLASLKLGERAKLYVSEAIGDNNFDLYGFAGKSERRCFEMLVSVSGIGPKAALSILSYNTPEGLALAVMNNDEKALTVAPGVGKKIAQRVILELKDKLKKEMGGQESGLPAVQYAASTADSGPVNDALTALAMLGYSTSEISPVLRNIDINEMSAEKIIKAVLKHMVK